MPIIKNTLRAHVMAPWVKGLAAKPCDPSLIPETYMEEEKNQLPQAILSFIVS